MYSCTRKQGLGLNAFHRHVDSTALQRWTGGLVTPLLYTASGLLVVVQLCDDEQADSSDFGDTRFLDFSLSYSFVGVGYGLVAPSAGR